MTAVRSGGRPAQGVGDVAARERLLIATRARMREHPPIKLHRRSIAETAGVAPGLVTYYFRDEPSLIEAAARPIIDGYLERLRVALSQDDGLDAKLHRLVDLLLEIGRNDGQLLDTYIRYIKQHNVVHKQDILAGSYSMIDAMLRLGEQNGTFRKVNIPFMSTVLWGICKTVSQLPELTALLQGGDATADGHAIVREMIMDLLQRVLRPDGASAG